MKLKIGSKVRLKHEHEELAVKFGIENSTGTIVEFCEDGTGDILVKLDQEFEGGFTSGVPFAYYKSDKNDLWFSNPSVVEVISY